jgi:heat shock protein HslJ
MKARAFETPALLLCAIIGAGALTTTGCVAKPEPAKEVSAQMLVDTHWRLTRLGAEVVDNPPGERDVHLTLQQNNLVVTGNSGCNRMFGHYAVSGNSIKFDQIGGTKMFCEARMKLEQQFLGMFEQVAGWKITGKTLELLDANGKAVAGFEAQDAISTP